MSATLPGNATWVLRPDLDIVRVDSLDGRPAMLVHDPVSGSFDRVEWPESDLIELLRSPRRVDEILNGFLAANTLSATEQDVAGYLTELGRKGWLRGSLFWPRAHRPRRRGGVLSLMAHALFIQIPLLQPENFLRATAWLVRLILNPLTYLLLFLCGASGLYLALPRWESYWQDSLGSFELARLPAFMLALALVKTVHEFAHAYVATMYGARVASMGIAFFFFMPLPFTDVTDAWRLDWPKRLRVASAGMLAEMSLAGVSLLLWALSPPGDAAATLARLSSVAVLSTLLTNLNPGPRFDGYYVLVCLFRTENLRARGTGELRRIIWRRLLGIETESDEGAMSRKRRFAMIAYACYAVFYRFSLGLALALMAYYMFPKAIGLPLAAIELWLFFGVPVVVEARMLWRNMGKIRFTFYMALALALLGLFAVWFWGDWPHRITFPAVTRSSQEEAVRTQRGGVVAEVSAERGGRVAKGEQLALLESPGDEPLLRRAEWALRESELSEEQAWRGDRSRQDTAASAAETTRRRVELEALRQRGDYLSVRSPIAGSLSFWERSLEPGVPVSRGKLMGWVTDGPVNMLVCYPGMEMAERLEIGARVDFFPDDGGAKVAGQIVRVDESRPELLEDGQLATVLGAVRSGEFYVLPRPYAKVTVRLDENMPRIGQTGTVWVWSKPESMATRTMNWLRALAVRESAF